MKKLFKS